MIEPKYLTANVYTRINHLFNQIDKKNKTIISELRAIAELRKQIIRIGEQHGIEEWLVQEIQRRKNETIEEVSNERFS